MAFERGTFTGDPNGCLWIVAIFSAAAIFGGYSLVAQSPEPPIVQEAPTFNGEPAEYLPPGARFGLDPIGQAIVRGREDSLSQERRIRLLERQVAQLQRVVFNDPNIRPPSYPNAVPSVPGGIGQAPIGQARASNDEE